jgi:signal transduction histidine kinase
VAGLSLPHPRSVRAKVVCLLLVPIVSVTTLWGLAGVGTAQNVYTLIQLRQLNDVVQIPLDRTIADLQAERTATAWVLGGGAASTKQISALSAAYTATDDAAADLRTGADTSAAAAAGLSAQMYGSVRTLLADFQALPSLRGETRLRQVTWATAEASYTNAVADALAVQETLATIQDGQVASDEQAVLCLARSREMLARQDAVLAAARAAGSLDAAGYREFTGALYSQTTLADAALPGLRATDAAAYRSAEASADYTRLGQIQQAIAADGPADARFTALDDAWNATAAPIMSEFGQLVANAGTAAVAQVDPYSRGLATKAGAAVIVGLIAIAVSLLVSVRIGRGLVLELVGLRDSALDLAARRLPRTVARLRAGHPVDVAAQVPPTPVESDEISQVGAALAQVHRAALQAAVERAEAISGVAGVFLNLARRSQILIHRQLALLDAMERRVEDPDELEDLFRLDHLATRMRRHAEGLLILSGAAPGRGWRRPMPLMDVVRAAVAEVEDYARVDVRRIPDIRVAGGAVADLAHLIAELVENATMFAPPHTRVRVCGEQVASGYVLEIEDRGLGMGAPALADANRRIASTRQSDLFDSDRLGLFVVSRLARRHDVKVSLRPSPYGGTTAVVLVPAAILETGALSGAAALGSADAASPGASDGTSDAHGGHAVDTHAVESPAVNTHTFDSHTARPSVSRQAGAGSATLGKRDSVRLRAVRANDRESVLIGPPAANAESSGDDADAPATVDGFVIYGDSECGPNSEHLPRRVRQANLAAPLRETPEPPSRDDSTAEPAPRAPDQVRSTMAAFQSGWSRGRAEHPAPDEEAAAREPAAAAAEPQTAVDDR